MVMKKIIIICTLLPFLLFSQQRERAFADNFYLQLDGGVGIWQNDELSGSHNSTFYLKETRLVPYLGASLLFRNRFFKSALSFNAFREISGEGSINLLFFDHSRYFYLGPMIKYGQFLSDNTGTGKTPSWGYGLDFYARKIHVGIAYTIATTSKDLYRINNRYLFWQFGYSFNLDSFRKKENRHAQ